MQRKVFHIDGEPVLATRGGGLFETAATLEGLLVLGRERIRGRAAPASAGTPQPPPSATPVGMAEPRPAAKREPRRAARRMEASAPTILPATEGPAEPAPPSPASPIREPDPRIAPAAEARRDRGSREPRWITAGAERRGRAAVHWSTRLR